MPSTPGATPPLSPAVHSFKESLKFAEKQEPYRQWLYPLLFGTPASYTSERGERLQSLGVDYWVTSPFYPGSRIAVEEKFRRSRWDGSDWSDVLLEYRCGEREGWINKPSSTDILLYCFPGRCLVLPWPALSQAWRVNGDHWRDLGLAKESGFSIPKAVNPGYESEGVAVPIPVLLGAVVGSRVAHSPNAEHPCGMLLPAHN